MNKGKLTLDLIMFLGNGSRPFTPEMTSEGERCKAAGGIYANN